MKLTHLDRGEVGACAAWRGPPMIFAPERGTEATGDLCQLPRLASTSARQPEAAGAAGIVCDFRRECACGGASCRKTTSLWW